ncbi:hypothetical protein HNO91_12065 [Pseudomonas corrugata]|uniref:Uncharacterized protein n=1 Tax=Pseudomonas corrugata TaxID=47879 RepID=A0A7Y6DH42_9PSED|nr:hypothetical protein [Pseudomonas corrugata]NUT87162.1 hypothetical protein [Pseudomonas corrugata]
MSAPDLTPQIPGEPLATMTPIASAVTTATGESTTAQAQAPLYVAKHNGGGRWIVIDENAPLVDGKVVKVGDFVGASKEEAEAEAQRLAEGGEPLVIDAQRDSDREALSQPKPAATGAVDPTTLKQAVLTPDGWLCPEPKGKE